MNPHKSPLSRPHNRPHNKLSVWVYTLWEEDGTSAVLWVALVTNHLNPFEWVQEDDDYICSLCVFVCESAHQKLWVDELEYLISMYANVLIG